MAMAPTGVKLIGNGDQSGHVPGRLNGDHGASSPWADKEWPYLLRGKAGLGAGAAHAVAAHAVAAHAIAEPPARALTPVSAGTSVPVSAAVSPAAVSPGLCRLMNAALVDPVFCAGFLASPLRAAELAADAPDVTFGCALPDATLQFAPLHLTGDDWALIRRLDPAQTIAERWGQIHHLAALDAGLRRAPYHLSDHA